ncbi:hypothetical protein JY651_26290 [Pyxidicoccus parkwayensis]|uniref:non-specific serine/threonine protein kinase n=1 Tax=Pyxidicoccus parkwayensis TaxID=2813578 RepID=A0ABX7NJ32_9BACT|nr:RIO1 family regulatory kinase/ATPase [Pyxidicoccus parkwaysis]QSQ18870.1 hypothetical protein JY651_26290 [Pyxidicoccus parkwaysis]
MNDSLETLLADGIIEAVIGQLKTGKEAEVWLVQHAGEVVAAKLYKERHERNFRNNAGYREGREVRNSRTRRAIEKGSRFGQASAEDAWKSAESDSLYKLHAQGVRVPTPVIFYEGILLMELVLDAHGHPAPRLVEAPPATPEDAHALYLDLRAQVVNMLCADLIHGDLSPYNILMSWQGATIIDFPQTVAAARNNRAEFYFRRDLDNVRNFLAGIAPWLYDMAGDTGEIWNAYVRRELTPDFTPKGNFREAPRRNGGQGRGAKGPRDGRQGFNPERAGDTGHPRGFRAEPVVEPAPVVVQSTMTPEEAAEAELRELEALVLKQGGGERGKPQAAPPPRGGRNRFGGGRSNGGRPPSGGNGGARTQNNGPRAANGAQASGGGARGGNGRPANEQRPAGAPNEQRAGGNRGTRFNEQSASGNPGAPSNGQRGNGNPGARFNEQRGNGNPGARLNEQRAGTHPDARFNEQRAGTNPDARFNEQRAGTHPDARINEQRAGGNPGAPSNGQRGNGNPGTRPNERGGSNRGARVNGQRGGDTAARFGEQRPRDNGTPAWNEPLDGAAPVQSSPVNDSRATDGRPSGNEPRSGGNGRPPRNEQRPGRNGRPPRNDVQAGGNGFNPPGEPRGGNTPRVERRGGPGRAQPVVETRPTPAGVSPGSSNTLREPRPAGTGNGQGSRPPRQGPNRGGPRPQRGQGPQVSFVARPASSSDPGPHETGS